MEIKNVEIIGYKGISDLKFNPKKLNILVGKNNTGKTSVLQAIDLLFNNSHIMSKNMESYFNIYSKKPITISANTDKKNKKTIIREASEVEIVNEFVSDLINNFLRAISDKEIIKSKLFIKEELEKIVIKEIDDKFRKFLLKNSLVLKNEEDKEFFYYDLPLQDDEKIESLIKSLVKYIQQILDNKKELDLRLRPIYYLTMRYMIQDKRVKIHDKEIIFSYDLLKNLEDEDIFSKRKPEDSERLHKIELIIKENNLISNLESLDFDNVLFSTQDGIKGHSFNFLGDGFKSIIGLLWNFLDAKENSIILLDEPESHMHPGYIEQLIKFIIDFSKKSNIQFFITTHSSDVLEIILSENLAEDEISYVKKELNILKMDKIKNSITLAESLDYNTAKETKEDLLLDLRGA